MHRFSIRTQLMLLSGSFIVTLAVFAAIAWSNNNRLGASIHATHDNFSQNGLLTDLYRDIAEAQLDILLFASDEEGHVESLRENLAQIAASVALAEDVFINTEIADQALPDVVGKIQDIAGRLDSVSGDVDRMAGLPRGMRSFVIGFDLIAVLQESRETIQALKSDIEVRVERIEQTADADVANSSLTILLATAVLGVLAVLIGAVFGVYLSAPIVAISGRVEGLAVNDYDTDIPGMHRQDEVGVAARALSNLRERL